jgi:ribonuclease P protein component
VKPLPNIQTLTNNHEFRRAYHRGKSFRDPALVTYCNKNRAGICRIGITASKKIGNAVQRNRARRVIMAAFRAVHEEIHAGVDIVFVARSKTVRMKSTEIELVMRKQLALAGLLKKN